MITLTLTRKWFLDESILGELAINGNRHCYTLELPWRDNQPYVSCIPAGRYWVRVRNGQEEGSRFRYRHLHVVEVPGRSWILVHKGNQPSDVTGCILVGMSKGTSNDQNWVGSSKAAFDSLMGQITETGEQAIELRIEEEPEA